MKRIVAILTVLMILCFSGCGQSSTTPTTTVPTSTETTTSALESEESTVESTTEYFADEDFLTAFARGLENRWETASAQEAAGEVAYQSIEYKNHMEECIKIELTEIEDFRNLQFKDASLQEICIKYINLLNKCLEECEYIPVDFDKFDSLYTPLNNDRTALIKQLVNEYGLTVSPKWQDQLNVFLTNAKMVEDEQDMKSEVQGMIDSIVFELAEEDYGWSTYSAIVENTTSQTFDYISFEIKLKDENDIIVASVYADSINHFAPGEKAKISFSTDKSFVSYEIHGEYYLN